DDQGRVEEAAAAVTRLVETEKAVLILGEVASTRSIAMAEVAEAVRIPMITPASTNSKVTEGKAYVFRVCFTDTFQGFAMARFARETLKISKVAVLKAADNDYSAGLVQAFTSRFRGMGGKIVKDETYAPGERDFKAHLAAIKASQAEAIYIPGYYGEVGLAARQARELGIAVPLLGGDGWSSKELFGIGGEAVEGGYFTNHYSTQDPSPRVQEFVADYKAAFRTEPDSFAALGYDAMRVAANAISRASGLSGDELRDAIAATRDFDGVTGAITIDARHNAAKPAVVLKIVGGATAYQTTIAPERDGLLPVGSKRP
ncbi:MAG: ABC transporter substrate-binding protein, partial [Deltaproteobacteria bacterium]|nr:ABC transporter substrate-binding protein [Deltaproteobacteria bacterium]